jgi:thioesterase III
MLPILVHRYPLQIVEKHLDTFGHVNNATYLNLFEEARWDWITNRGFGLDTIRATRTGPVVLEAHVRFKREMQNRENAQIETRFLEQNRKVSRIAQILFKEGHVPACEAEFVVGFFDLEQRKLIVPSPAWLTVLTAPLE